MGADAADQPTMVTPFDGEKGDVDSLVEQAFDGRRADADVADDDHIFDFDQRNAADAGVIAPHDQTFAIASDFASLFGHIQRCHGVPRGDADSPS
jgi:hypothetical protein